MSSPRHRVSRRLACCATGPALVFLALASAPGASAQQDPVAPPAAAAPLVRVSAWNDLGMHCTDPDFSIFATLPPFNTIQAQVTVDGQLLSGPGAYSVTYRAIADASGSINSTSVGKTGFWDHVEALFGTSLAPDKGLAGFDMPGPDNTPQPMTWDQAFDGFIARGIPITPFDDGLGRNTYPMMRVEVRNGAGAVVASTDIVLPISDEMSCSNCHASGGLAAAQPAAGWVNDPDPLRDDRLNILLLHDEKNAGNPAFTSALSSNGFSSDGLYASVVVDGHPVLCAACHLSNALPGTGTGAISPLTEAIHTRHAAVIDPVTGLALDDTSHRSACYQCHPGSETRCLRGAMGAAVAPDGTLSMQCQSCHSSMSEVGTPGRVGWLDEPSCGNCHTGTATDNSGQIRFETVYDAPGHRRTPANTTYQTNPNTPSAGFSLYRMSSGHGGLQCSACHGSTHAIFPSSHTNDNVGSMQAQGHVGELSDCTTCHASSPKTESGGPHGMHPVGQSWVHGHADGDGDDDEGSSANCSSCHGVDLKGTVLSRALGDRTLSTEFGTKSLWRGATVSCWLCHNGPNSESKSKDAAPVVKGAAVEVDNLQPTAIQLTATDADKDSLTLRIVTQSQHGTVGLSGKTATYFPEGGYLGLDAFTYAAWDGKIESNLGTLALSMVDAACPLVLSSASENIGSSGGGGSVSFTLAAECPWSVSFASPTVSWLTLMSPTAGTGDGVVIFEAASNTDASARSTQLLVAGKVFTVHQAGTSGPDLSGEWLTHKERCKTKQGALVCKVRGKLLLTNTGDQLAAKSVLRVYLSDDQLFDASDVLLQERAVKKLQPGKQTARKIKAKLPAGITASGRYIIAVLDAEQTLAEIVESDDVVVSVQLP